MVEISATVRDEHGFLLPAVESLYQSGSMQIGVGVKLITSNLAVAGKRIISRPGGGDIEIVEMNLQPSSRPTVPVHCAEPNF